MRTLVIYHTKTGHTLEAINPMVEGLKLKGAEVTVRLAADFQPHMLTRYDSFIVATPCWGGSTGLSGVATPLIKVINSLEDNALKGKKCGGVAIHASTGGQTTLGQLEKLLARKGCETLIKAPVVKAGVPFSL